jgi:hypothetical protein
MFEHDRFFILNAPTVNAPYEMKLRAALPSLASTVRLCCESGVQIELHVPCQALAGSTDVT